MYVTRLEEAENGSEFGARAEALAKMKKSGLPVPLGFVVGANALSSFLSANSIKSRIRSLYETKKMDAEGVRDLEREIRGIFLDSVMPADMKKEIVAAYEKFSLSDEVTSTNGAALDLIRAGRGREKVSVRSSVVKDSGKSFAGVTETNLNVCGEDELIRSIKLSWASLFSPYAMIYREAVSAPGEPQASVIVQRMQSSEKGGSMLAMFGNDKVLVEGSWGMGNAVSSGIVTPDEYLLDSSGSLIEKNISKKLWMYKRDASTGKTEKEHVPGMEMDSQVLTETELRKLCGLAVKVQNLFSGQQLTDWCISRGRIFILDTKDGNYEVRKYESENSGDVLVTGRCASSGTASGTVRMVSSGDGQPGMEDIAVSADSSVGTLLIGRGAKGFVTDEGGRLCNFSVISRELNVPALTATKNATSVLRDGMRIEVLSDLGKAVSVPEEETAKPEGHAAGESSSAGESSLTYPQAFPANEGVETVQPETEQPIETIQTVPSPAPQPEAVSEAHEDSQVIGTKIFASLMTGASEIPAGVDGVILHDSQNEAGVPATGVTVPLWLMLKGEDGLSEALGVIRNLQEGGSDAGLILPALRGVSDLERVIHQIPPNVKTGVFIRTPAMALHADSLLREGIKMVCLDIKSLIQLGMGLHKPEPEMHPAVLGMVSSVVEKCHENNIKCCVNVSSEHFTDENAESLVRAGVDIIGTEPENVRELKNMILRAEKKMLLEGGTAIKDEVAETGDSPGTAPAAAPGETSEEFSLPLSFS